MAFKILILLCSAAMVAAGHNDCPCNSEKSADQAAQIKNELEEFKEFLLKTPERLGDVDFMTIPGELSPIVSCLNCINKDRRKRKADDPQPMIPRARPVQQRPIRKKPLEKRRHYYRGRVVCPSGHTWLPIVNICANTEIYKGF